ncbi:MAG: hypothetical protein P1V35_05810, partial [Planctomycetota bacterium]|nr:hypothetical protein [Planctomycetota bacterium]
MKHNLLYAALIAVLSSSGSHLVAQVPSPNQGSFQAKETPLLPVEFSPGALSALGEELLIDEPGDGRTWARGPQWKASFGSEGLVYIPFFGSDAPQNYPVQLDLARVAIEGEPIELLGRNRGRDGQSVNLDRGSLVEVYHLTKSTVEQTFVFEELTTRGELVLDITVKTELFGSESADGGFTFSNELGEVRYGSATAIDARGQSIQLRQRLTADGIRIVVPKDFVQSAQLPLVVDPILSTHSITSDSRRQL